MLLELLSLDRQKEVFVICLHFQSIFLSKQRPEDPFPTRSQFTTPPLPHPPSPDDEFKHRPGGQEVCNTRGRGQGAGHTAQPPGTRCSRSAPGPFCEVARGSRRRLLGTGAGGRVHSPAPRAAAGDSARGVCRQRPAGRAFALAPAPSRYKGGPQRGAPLRPPEATPGSRAAVSGLQPPLLLAMDPNCSCATGKEIRVGLSSWPLSFGVLTALSQSLLVHLSLG